MECSSITHNLIRSAVEELNLESQADMSLDIDEIVFSYIAGILEESLNDLDMDEFISIMDAYVPGFASIQVDTVMRFLKRLEVQISTQRAEESSAISAEGPRLLPTGGGKPRRRDRRTSHRQNSESKASIPSTPPATSCEIAFRGLQQRTLSEASSADQGCTEFDENSATNLSNLGMKIFGSPTLPGDGDSFFKHTTLKSQSDSHTISESDSHTQSSEGDCNLHHDSTSTFEGLCDPHRLTISDDSCTRLERNSNSSSTADSDSALKERDDGEKAKSTAIGTSKTPLDLSDKSVTVVKPSSEIEVNELLETLIEMFPEKSTIDLEKSLKFNCNNLEAAVVCLLDDGAAGEMVVRSRKPSKEANITMRHVPPNSSRQKKHRKTSRKKSNSQSFDEGQETEAGAEEAPSAKIKSLILDKYSYISSDAELKTYNPKLQTNDVKKMVRYRNGKIVSTKGERFSDVSPALTDEMKKTYINLKPAKQYRFH